MLKRTHRGAGAAAVPGRPAARVWRGRLAPRHLNDMMTNDSSSNSNK